MSSFITCSGLRSDIINTSVLIKIVFTHFDRVHLPKMPRQYETFLPWARRGTHLVVYHAIIRHLTITT
ncbi:hypothetical protein O181_048706 [Austropuccinia psidii MF-1]|uniref:Uncharacterized protein n=1 Tax=Austropuccinia psidii MF-1 TaxID=1389203 RepID=A0A9Q3HKN3_9BASI|nr:hypothetical protein [Austropuccinia psidii MF-1]